MYRAKCCNPIRGEAIVGYVTRGKGVAVHSTNCPNVQNLMYEVERKIDVEWARATSDAFPVKIVVHTDDRPGHAEPADHASLSTKTPISAAWKRKTRRGSATARMIDMTVEVQDKKQLEKLVVGDAPHLRRARRGANSE